jgi:predicted  nucleic acid-binding Zn-ribbon protein
MKTSLSTRTALSLALTAGVAWLLVGCGTTRGYKKADQVGAGIADFGAEIINGKKAIDDTVIALDAVATSASIDPRKAFEEYTKQVANLESTANKIRKRAQDVRDKGQSYFKQWEQDLASVNNPEVRKLAEERKAKLQQTFDTIRQYTEPLKTQFDPWLSDLKDLQKYLSNDLTVGGVDAAKSLFTKTQSQGLEVQKSMDALVAELNTIAAAITPAKAKPAK